MTFTTFAKLGGLPETVIGMALGLGIWGFYGFPYALPVAVGCISLGCIGAFVWRLARSQHG